MRTLRQLSGMLDSMPLAAQVLLAAVLVAYSVVSVYGRLNTAFGARVFSRVPKERIRSDAAHIFKYTIVPLIVTCGYVLMVVSTQVEKTAKQRRRAEAEAQALANRKAREARLREAEAIERAFESASTQILGQYLAAKCPGGRVAVLTGPQGEEDGRTGAFVAGLRLGLGTAAESMLVLTPGEPRHRDSPPNRYFTAGVAEDLFTGELADMQVVVSFIGLPMGFAESPFWDRPEDQRPVLALWGGMHREYDRHLASGRIAALVAAHSISKWVGATVQETFDRRYRLITPESVAANETGENDDDPGAHQTTRKAVPVNEMTHEQRLMSPPR